MEKRFIAGFMALQVFCFLMLGALKAQTLADLVSYSSNATAQEIKDHLLAYKRKNPQESAQKKYVNDEHVYPSVLDVAVITLRDLDLAKFLLDYGYVIKEFDYTRAFTQLYEDSTKKTADYMRNSQILRLLIERGDVSFINYKSSAMGDDFLLGKLCKNGDLDLVSAIFDRVKNRQDLKEEFLAKGDSLSSLLYIASNSSDNSQNRLDLIDYLINQGADLDQKGGYATEPPLMAAYKKPNMTIVNFLLEKGANINTQDSSGQTLLKLAYEKNDSAAITNFINKGADVNIHLDSSKTTPLIRACENNDVEQVKLLVEKGAHVNAYNTSNETPLIKVFSWLNMISSSEFNKKKEIINFLIAKNADVNHKMRPPLISLCYYASSDEPQHVLELIDLLINRGAQVNITNQERDTPLLTACQYDRSGLILNKLIARGADVKHVNNLKRTAMHIAALYKNYALIPILVKADAKVNELDSDKNTPLYLLLDKYNLDNSDALETIRALVDNGANCAVPNKAAKLPAEIIVEKYINQVTYDLSFGDSEPPVSFEQIKSVLELVLSAYSQVIQEKNLVKLITTSAVSQEEKTKFLALFESIPSKNIASGKTTGGGSKQPEKASPITQPLKTLQQKLSELQSQLKNLAQKLTGLKAKLTP